LIVRRTPYLHAICIIMEILAYGLRQKSYVRNRCGGIEVAATFLAELELFLL